MNHQHDDDGSNELTMEEYEWDSKSSFTTAWSTMQSKKGRRAYGRRSSAAATVKPTARAPPARSNSNNKKRSLQLVEEEEQRRRIESADVECLALSRRSSSISSVDFDRSELSFRASFSSSSSSNENSLWNGFLDSSSTNNENSNPNVMLHESSPLPPTKVKKVQAKIPPDDTASSSSSSFSHLARRSGEAATWASVAGHRILRSDSSPLHASPTSSEEGSNKKRRGVCESPLTQRRTSSSSSSSSLISNTRKSRSRIYSPNSDLLQHSAAIRSRRSQRRKDVDSDDESESDAPQSADVSFESTASSTCSSQGLFRQDSSFMPPKTLRRSSLDGFQESVFGSDSIVSGSVSWYEDLVFLIRALRKEKRGTAAAGFGLKSWTVAPQVTWKPKRRTAFLQWTTKRLGFSLRSAGGASVFVQTTATKGADVLQKLEQALKEKRKQERPKPEEPEQPLFASIPMERSNQNIPFSRRKTSPDSHVDEGLSELVNSLSLDDKPDKTTEAPRGPLVRTVTLDTNVEMELAPSSHVATLPSCNEDDNEDAESSFDADQPSRPSGEHHVGGQELVQHMHVWSPRTTSDGDMRKCSGHNNHKLLRGIRLPRNSVSPMVSCSKPSAIKNALEFVETPMQLRSMKPFGSSKPRHGGREWQTSTPCDNNVIEKLFGIFNETACEHAAESGTDNQDSSSCFATDVVLSSSDLGFELEMDRGSDLKDPDVVESANDMEESSPSQPGHHRRSSVGATFFAELNLDDGGSPAKESSASPEKAMRRRMRSLATKRRMSLCASAMDPMRGLQAAGRHSMFGNRALRTSVIPEAAALTLSDRMSSFPLWGVQEVDSPVSEQKVPTASVVAEILVGDDTQFLDNIFMFLEGPELVQKASAVCTHWADVATDAYATLMLINVGCCGVFGERQQEEVDLGDDIDEETILEDVQVQEPTVTASIARSMEKPWKKLIEMYPWANFLSEGAFKQVYRVYNTATKAEEAVSVMDVKQIESMGTKDMVGRELAVSVMLSSLARRKVCPNFVITRGVFTCPFAPPASHWGCRDDKHPKGKRFVSRDALGRAPRQPNKNTSGSFQYIRMELCCKGDAEEYMKELPNEMMEPWEVRSFVFQSAFALHAAGDRYSMKHYDVKLLNFFLQDANAGRDVDSTSDTVLRYGLGSHVFAIRMPSSRALVTKLADYGTATVGSESDGQPVNIGHFTTLENSPPEFLILGDAATQGYGHDCFALGLCVLHLFTGHKPYEEILEDVECPPALFDKLQKIWEEAPSHKRTASSYEVIRSLILSDVDEDEYGNIEGEKDLILYHTLYRYLVLFGIPDKFKSKKHGRVLHAISSCLQSSRNREAPDAAQFARDQAKYSLRDGQNRFIARARQRLMGMDGGMDMIMSLVNFDPKKRSTPLDVLNSTFMMDLREEPGVKYDSKDVVHSYMSFHSSNHSARRA